MRRAARAATATVVGLLGLGCAVGTGDPAPSPSPSPTVTGPPVASADYAEIGMLRDADTRLVDLGFNPLPLRDQGMLVGAHYGFVVAEAALTDVLTMRQREALYLPAVLKRGSRQPVPLMAGPGHEFLLTAFGDIDGARRSGRTPINSTIIVAGVNRELETELVPALGVVLVVKVPVGADAVLEIDSADEVKSISLRTGEVVRAGDTRPADLLRRGSVELHDYVRTPGLTAPGWVDGIGVSISANPRSHIPGPGLPEPGQMWLELEVRTSYVRCEECPDEDHGVYAIRIARSLTMRLADGTAVSLPESSTAHLEKSRFDRIWGGSWQGRIQVPEGAETFDLTWQTDGLFNRDGDVRTLERQARGQVNHGVLTLPRIN